MSSGSATLSADTGNTLQHPQSLDFNPGLIELQHPWPPNLHMTENDPSSVCALLPLQSDQNFRLLELSPGYGNAPLATQLIVSGVDDSYEVLSCEGGNTLSDSVSIAIGTGTTSIKAAIPPNLANALKALRDCE